MYAWSTAENTAPAHETLSARERCPVDNPHRVQSSESLSRAARCVCWVQLRGVWFCGSRAAWADWVLGVGVFSYDQIQSMNDLPKLYKLEKYMRYVPPLLCSRVSARVHSLRTRLPS